MYVPAESLKVVAVTQMHLNHLAARRQTGDDNREDTVMDLRRGEAEGDEVGTMESEIKREKNKRERETRAEETELG